MQSSSCAVCRSSAVKKMCGRCGAFQYCSDECSDKMRELHLAVCLDKTNRDAEYVAQQLEKAIVDMQEPLHPAGRQDYDAALHVLGELRNSTPGSEEQMDMVDEAKDVLIHHLYNPVGARDPMPGLCQLAVARLSQAAKYEERAEQVRIEADTKWRKRRDSYRSRRRSFSERRKDTKTMTTAEKINELNRQLADARISQVNHERDLEATKRQIESITKERDRLQAELLQAYKSGSAEVPRTRSRSRSRGRSN